MGRPWKETKKRAHTTLGGTTIVFNLAKSTTTNHSRALDTLDSSELPLLVAQGTNVSCLKPALWRKI